MRVPPVDVDPARTEVTWRDNRFRIEMTSSCADCAVLPKVDNAGAVSMEDGTAIQTMHNGIKVVAGGYYGDWTTEIIARLRGHHEPQEELLFSEALKHMPPRATMLELGGFWSYYSLWFLHHAPARRAIVVEPDPQHLAVGKANAHLNHQNIEFLQASVGPDSIAEHEFLGETSGALRIPQVTVAQMLDTFGVGRLDLLHCDIQGGEVGVVQSCMGLLAAGRIQFCFISTHAHHISGDALTHQRCLALLKEAGGRILAEHDVHESYSGDGLIVAYFGDELNWPPLRISYNRYSTSLFRNPLFDLAECLKDQKPQALAELEADHARRLEHINTLDREFKKLKIKFDRSEADRERRLNDIYKLSAELKKLQAHYGRSEADRAQRLDDVNKINGELKKASAQLEQSEADRAKRLDDINKLHLELEDVRGQLDRSEADRAKRLEAINILDAELKNVQGLLVQSEDDRAKRLENINRLNDVVEDLQLRLERSEVDRARRLEDVNRLNSEWEALKTKLAQSEEDRAQRLRDINALHRDIEGLRG